MDRWVCLCVTTWGTLLEASVTFRARARLTGGSGRWDVVGDPSELIIPAPETMIGEGVSLWIKLLMYSRLVPQDRFPSVKFL